MDKSTDNKNPAENWKSLYRAGGFSALFAAFLLLAEIIVFTIWPQPDTAKGYFELFQFSRLVGLIDFYLLEFLAYILFLPIFIAISISLRKTNKGIISIALVIAVTGIAVFLSTNNPFSMLSLSDQYAAATTYTLRKLYLDTGHAILTYTAQRAFGGFNTGFFLLSIAGLMTSAMMLKGVTFKRTTAYIGIIAFSLSLADYIRVIFLSNLAILTLIIATVSGLLLLAWLILIGQRLLKLGDQVKGESQLKK